MSNKKNTGNSYTPIHWIMFCLAFLFSSLCFFYQVKYPPCCDADQYIEIAKHFLSTPLIWQDVTTRGYGYPFFISILIKFDTVFLF